MDSLYFFFGTVNFIILVTVLPHQECHAMRLEAPRAISSEEAKSFLRVKRGFFSTVLDGVSDAVTPIARHVFTPISRHVVTPISTHVVIPIARAVGLVPNSNENNEEQREAGAEAQRRETTVRLNRTCPALCWNPWGNMSACSQPCGSGGVQTQTRTPKAGAALGECQAWVAKSGCPGAATRSRQCNRQCPNGGTGHATGCNCTAGWKGRCCDAKMTCPAPGVPAHGTTTPNANGLHYGTVVRFSCNTGYNRVGPATRQCVGNGTWTNSVPACNIVSCGNPGTPANGKVEFTAGNSYVYGSTLRATCNFGYRLLGTTIRACQANGQWAGTAPSCQLIVCPVQPAPANGAVSYPNGRNLNDRLVYTCHTSYVLVGGSSRQCQSTSQWTTTTVACTQILCNNLAAPTDGKVTHGGTTNGKTPFGEKATFSCNQGYVLQGTAVLTCAGTSLVGQFNSQPPTCEPVDCGDPGNPANGVRSGSAFTLGQTVAFSCNPGYYLEGELSINCVHTGQWSSVKPLCKACALNTYKPGTSNAKTCSACPVNSGTGSITGASAETQCLCVLGYKGNPGGPCSLIQCPALPIPANGRLVSCGNKQDEKCIFACGAGHVISGGNAQRTCTEQETWTGSEVRCDACPRDTYRLSSSQCVKCPENSRTTGTGNEKVECVCVSGYAGSNGGPCTDINECSTSNGGCEQSCVNQPGGYTCKCTNAGYVKDLDDHKKCVSKNQCPEMTQPANGGVVCYSQRKTNTERCYVKCNNGFEHLGRPNAFETCGPSTNWQWSYDIENKPVPDCISTFFPNVELDMEVSYFKEDCLTLTDEEKEKIAQDFVKRLTNERVCTLSNQGTCSIDVVDISCGVEDTYEDEGFPDFGFPFRRKRDTRMGLVVKFKLKSKAKALPKDQECDAKCKAKVKDETQVQIAKEAKAVYDIFKKTNEESSQVTLGGVELQQTTKINVGDLALSCEEGQRLKNGSCVPVSCGLPKPPANGGMDVTGHLYNQKTKFKCNALYTLHGDNSTTCEADGKWSTYNTTCVHYRWRGK